MPVPKQRHTKSRRDKRRQHLKLKHKRFSVCPRCKSSILAHHMCQNCGYYKGREVVNVLAKLEKKEKKKREKEITKTEKEEAKTRSKEDRSKSKSLSMKELSKK